MKIHKNSAWTEAQIIDYLSKTNVPIRLACNDKNGYPSICSLWFIYLDGALWSASHKSAHIIKLLKSDSKISFEVATNDYPYHGVRGKADATLISDASGNVLGQLIDKYLQNGNKPLSDWLLSRKQDEYAIKIAPLSINAWDFSHRMQKDS